MLLIIVNTEGNKLFLISKLISSKFSIAPLSQNQGTYFYRGLLAHLRRNEVQENVLYCHVCLSNLKMRLMSCVLNEWLSTGSQNAILNDFEEYYICTERSLYA